MHDPRSSKGPQGATPRTRSASTTPTWTAGLNSVDDPHRRRLQFLQPPNLQAGGGPPRGTPKGPLEVVPQASTPQHFGVFVPRHPNLKAHPSDLATATAPQWLPSASTQYPKCTQEQAAATSGPQEVPLEGPGSTACPTVAARKKNGGLKVKVKSCPTCGAAAGGPQKT